MMVPELSHMANLFAERLLNTAGAGVVLAGLVWLLLRLFRGQNSATRFAVWFAALLAIVAFPFLGGSFFGRWSFMATHIQAFPSPHRGTGILLSSAWASRLFAAWAIGAGFLLLRLIAGLWQLRKFSRTCFELELAGLDPVQASILRDIKSRRRVELRVSNLTTVPAAMGFFRPTIVFPAGLLPQLSGEETETILLHEMAHLRRWDDWTNFAQKIVKALFFFHPAVWWIDRRLTLEREMACDDMVLEQTANPRAYASSLISFAEKLQSDRGVRLAQALVSRMHQMSLRLAQILDPKRRHLGGVRRPLAFVLGVAMLALTFSAAPYLPHIVDIQHDDIQHDRPPARPQQLMHTGQQASFNVEAPVTTAASRSVAPHVPRPAPVPRVIAAQFHTPAVVLALPAKQPSQDVPAVISAKASPADLQIANLPVRETIVLLRSTRNEASGTEMWTLCIWKVSGNERQLESAIFIGSI